MMMTVADSQGTSHNIEVTPRGRELLLILLKGADQDRVDRIIADAEKRLR